MVDRGLRRKAAHYDVVAVPRNDHGIRASGALHRHGVDLPVAAISLVARQVDGNDLGIGAERSLTVTVSVSLDAARL